MSPTTWMEPFINVSCMTGQGMGPDGTNGREGMERKVEEGKEG